MSLFSNFDDEIFEEVKEITGEVAVNEICVYKNEHDNICITVDGDGEKNRGFENDPYFKFYSTSDPTKSEPIRIAFTNTARYIVHNGNDDTLSSKNRKKLEKYMDETSFNNHSLTVWESIKNTTCEYVHNNRKKKEIMSLEKPDFRNDLK